MNFGLVKLWNIKNGELGLNFGSEYYLDMDLFWMNFLCGNKICLDGVGVVMNVFRGVVL